MSVVLIVPSPVGALFLREVAGKLAEVAFLSPTFSPETPFEQELAAAQLAEYFAGTRTRFDLPLAPVGTDFQRRVWAATAAIPFGETATYGEIARKIGVPTGSRAVGGALNRNPICLVVPWHRVVGSSGKLTGYDGGVNRKAFLLTLERPEAPRLF